MYCHVYRKVYKIYTFKYTDRRAGRYMKYCTILYTKVYTKYIQAWNTKVYHFVYKRWIEKVYKIIQSERIVSRGKIYRKVYKTVQKKKEWLTIFNTIICIQNNH